MISYFIALMFIGFKPYACLIYTLVALCSCQDAQPIHKKGIFISCIPEKDIVDQVICNQDTIKLHYRAVAFENYEFDTIFIYICKHNKIDTRPVLIHDAEYFFDKNKQLVGQGAIYTSCEGPQEAIQVAKGEQEDLFVEMPDFDLNPDSTRAIWGFGFFYMAYYYHVTVDSAGHRLQKAILISSGEKNFQNKPAFEELPGYKY